MNGFKHDVVITHVAHRLNVGLQCSVGFLRLEMSESGSCSSLQEGYEEQGRDGSSCVRLYEVLRASVCFSVLPGMGLPV